MTVHTSPSAAAPAVLSFWFDEVGQAKWFAKDAALDAEIARRFSGLRNEVLASGAKGWRDSPDTMLAAIVLLDQFSRNIFRDSAKAFGADPLALELAGEGLDRAWVETAAPDRRQFYLMPDAQRAHRRPKPQPRRIRPPQPSQPKLRPPPPRPD